MLIQNGIYAIGLVDSCGTGKGAISPPPGLALQAPLALDSGGFSIHPVPAFCLVWRTAER